MWKCHVNDSTKGRYNMMLVRDLSTELVFNLELSEHVIEAFDGNFKGSTTPMVDLGKYEFKDLNTGNFIPEESFTNYYIKEVYGSEHVHTATKI